jgi:TP901 family phage tail tape measure protein
MSVKPIVLPITYKSDPKGLRKAQDDLKGFARGIQKAVTGATLAVAGIGAASLKSFADFDAAMNQSLAIMGDVSDALRNEMSDAAREVAKTTTFSAKEAAESYFFLASAGLDAEQSIAALPKVAAFAQAGMFDMAQATDLLTDAQSALGLSSDDAAENLENMSGLADVLVKANTLANASVEQFASALTNKAAASMRTLSMDMEEGVAVLAVFADQGLKGEAAGTAFNATMIGLTKTARTNASAYDALGVSVFDSTGELRNMSDIVADLERGLDGMSTEQVDATLASLGLTRQALDGTKALLGNSDAIREYEEELRNAGGTVDEVAGKQLDTLAAQFDLLKSKIVDVGLEIGGQLEPIFKDLVQEMGPVIDEIADALVPAFEEVIVFVAEIVKELPALINALTPLLPVITQVASVVFGVVAQLLPAFIAVLNILLPIIESLTSFLSNNVEVVTAALVGIGSLVAIIKTWNTVVGIAKLAMAAFNAVLAMNPIGLIVLAVAALTAGLVWFFTQTEVGKQVWATFVEFFKMLIAGMVEFFNGMVENFRI